MASSRYTERYVPDHRFHGALVGFDPQGGFIGRRLRPWRGQTGGSTATSSRPRSSRGRGPAGRAAAQRRRSGGRCRRAGPGRSHRVRPRRDGAEPRHGRAGAGGGDPETVDPETEAAELIAQIRELAGPDPVAVRTVVADVLAALDRVSGGALREQLPYEHERVPDDDPAAAGGYPVEPHPVEPNPPEPHPTQPRPGPPQPGRPGPADPHPPAPEPGQPHPAEPHPTDPHPVRPRPTDPHPAEPGPVTPGPIERRPVQRSGEDRT
ncbi:hypothetical protein [Plantactinospora veratri]